MCLLDRRRRRLAAARLRRLGSGEVVDSGIQRGSRHGNVGEATCRVVPAAIANAFFDATGVRMRQAPLNPARVKTVLSKA